MPIFTGKILNGTLYCTTPAKFAKWLTDNKDSWWRGKFTIVGGCKNKHTVKQRGYYWAVLVPEILAELNRQGHKVKIELNNLEIEIPYNKETTHALLTGVCSRVGDDGDVMRLSDDDMTVDRMMRRIENVLDFAVNTLNMNAEALKAWRQQ